MKTKKEKKKAFVKEMEKLKKEGKLKEDKKSFEAVLKKSSKPSPSSR